MLLFQTEGFAYTTSGSPDTLFRAPSAEEMIVIQEQNGLEILIKNHGKENKIFLADSIDNHKGTSGVAKKRKSELWEKQHNFYIFPSRNPDRYWSIGIEGITLGMTSANGQPIPKGFQWGKSFEIGWLSIVDFKYSFYRSVLSLGVGLNWRNYKNSTSYRYLSLNENSDVVWKNYTPGTQGKNSQLKIFAIQLPLLYEYSVPNTSLYFKIGPILNFNSYSSIKTSFIDQNGNNSSYFSNRSIQKTITADLFANVSIGRMIGIFCRYSPMKILNSTDGINFHPFTLGVSVGI